MQIFKKIGVISAIFVFIMGISDCFFVKGNPSQETLGSDSMSVMLEKAIKNSIKAKDMISPEIVNALGFKLIKQTDKDQVFKYVVSYVDGMLASDSVVKYLKEGTFVRIKVEGNKAVFKCNMPDSTQSTYFEMKGDKDLSSNSDNGTKLMGFTVAKLDILQSLKNQILALFKERIKKPRADCETALSQAKGDAEKQRLKIGFKKQQTEIFIGSVKDTTSGGNGAVAS